MDDAISQTAIFAASATLALLPAHRQCTPLVDFAEEIQRYFDLVRLPPVTVNLALLYLHRLTSNKRKTPFPVEEYSATRIFVAVYALANIHLDDNAYANRAWCQVLKDGITMKEWNCLLWSVGHDGLNWKLETSDAVWKAWSAWLKDWWMVEGQLMWHCELKSIAKHHWSHDVTRCEVDWQAEENDMEAVCQTAVDSEVSDVECENSEDPTETPQLRPVLSSTDVSSMDSTPVRTPTSVHSRRSFGTKKMVGDMFFDFRKEVIDKVMKWADSSRIVV